MTLQTRFVFIYGVGGIVFLSLVALLIFARMEAAMVGQLREKFEFDARQRIAAVQRELADRERYFRFSAELPMFRAMRYYQQILNEAALQDQVRYLELYFLEFARNEPGLRSMRYVGEDGREVLRIDQGVIARKLVDLSLDDRLVQPLRLAADEYLVVPEVSADGAAELVWWVPVSAAARTVTGLLAFHLSPNVLHNRLGELVKGEFMEICLEDAQGVQLFSTMQQRCNDNSEPVWKVSDGLGLRGIDWKLHVVAEPAQLLTDVYRLRWLIFGGLLPLLALLGFAVTVLLSRQITSRIEPVVAAAKALGQGSPVAPIVTDAKDEVGVLAREMNRASRLVEEKQQALRESNAELESYSYTIAHDLRAPLRAVTSFSQLLQEEARQKLNEEEQDFLRRIVAAGKRMSQLIDDILELSRISRLQVQAVTVDLSALAREIASEFAEQEPQRKVDWLIQDGITVYGDASLLKLLLQNLLGNAWKYSSKETTARIELRQLWRDGGQVLLVRDNGVGFDMDYAKKLFEPFHRLHKDEEFEGSGVGLATVKRIVTRHAGNVRVESQLGEGTTVYFALGLNPAG